MVQFVVQPATEKHRRVHHVFIDLRGGKPFVLNR